MSIIQPKEKTPINVPRVKASKVKRSARQTTDHIIRGLEVGLKNIWKHHSPEDVLAELGTDAVESFEISRKTVAFLADILAGKRQEDLDRILATVAAIPPFTEHEDGTVTLDEE